MKKIKLNHQDAVIFHQMLKNMKPILEEELENSPKKGAGIISHDWIRRVWDDATEQLDTQLYK